MVMRTLEAVTKDHVLETLAALQNDKAKTAKVLGIGLKTLYSWLKKWGMLA